MFWGLLIIPVYELAGLGDFVIFNLIEFWTGKNPIAQSGGSAPEIRGLADGAIELRHGDAVYILRPLAEDRFELSSGERVLALGRVEADGVLVLQVVGRADEVRLGRDALGQLATRLETAGLLAAR